MPGRARLSGSSSNKTPVNFRALYRLIVSDVLRQPDRLDDDNKEHVHAALGIGEKFKIR